MRVVYGTPALRSAGRNSLPTSNSAGWKNHSGPGTWMVTSGCGTVLLFRLRLGKQSADASRFVRSSTVTHSIFIKLILLVAGLRIALLFARESRRSTRGFAIIVTPVPL